MVAMGPCSMSCAKTRQPDARRSGCRRIAAVVRGCLAAACVAGCIPAGAAFESGRAALSVTVNDEIVIPYRVFAVFVLPGEVLELASEATDAAADDGRLERAGERRWRWRAPPRPGVATIRLAGGGDEIRLNAIVMHPMASVADEHLLGYRIGSYPEPLEGDPVYLAPDGFIELTDELTGLELSPHFTLGQFPSKQSMDYPRYLVLREGLLLKLELLLERVNETGVSADTFTVMSGFRTPSYNRAIGNGQHSRHIYGGAADVYIDVEPRDDIMDDLNGDGAFDYRDAQWLYRLADELFGRDEHVGLRGGLGVYRATPAHGPFLHVDARGRRARWGLLP